MRGKRDSGYPRKRDVAVDGIEPSRARVWAAAVPCTDCELADEVRGSGLRDPFGTTRIKSPVTERHRPAKTYHREDSNLSRQPSQRCVPSLERWRNRNGLSIGRSGGSRTQRSFAPDERIEAGLVLSIVASPEALRRVIGDWDP